MKIIIRNNNKSGIKCAMRVLRGVLKGEFAFPFNFMSFALSGAFRGG